MLSLQSTEIKPAGKYLDKNVFFSPKQQIPKTEYDLFS